MSLRIAGWGVGLPRQRVTSAELERELGLSEGWIAERTGIQERRFCTGNETVASLGAIAVERALQSAALSPDDVDLLICSTSTGEWSQPHTAAAIHGAANLPADIPCWDVNGVCSGFVHALASGAALLHAHPNWRHVVVVGAERYSSITNPTDHRTRILFGDGAGALVLARTPHQGTSGLGPLVGHTKFSGHKALIVPAGGTRLPDPVAPDDRYFQMDGRAVRAFGTSALAIGIARAAEAAGITVADLDLIAPHQSNLRMLEAARDELGLAPDQLLTSITELGNTASASIPITLGIAADAGRLRQGARIGLVGYGGGLSYAATILTW